MSKCDKFKIIIAKLNYINKYSNKRYTQNKLRLVKGHGDFTSYL